LFDRAAGAGHWNVMLGKPKLACAEGDDAADRVVRRDANGNPVARHDFDPKPAHAPAELREHLVARVALHAVEPTAVHRNDGALNINQVVLTQSKSFRRYASIVPQVRTTRKVLRAKG